MANNSAKQTQSTFWDKLGDFIGWGSAARQREADAYQAELNREFQRQERIAAQEYNSAEAQIAFNREMQASNTAVQRQVADMQQAGINPILAGSYGGASTPTSMMGTSTPSSGSKAQMTSANNEGKLLDIVGNIVEGILGNTSAYKGTKMGFRK